MPNTQAQATVVLSATQAAFVRLVLSSLADQAHVCGWAPTLGQEDTEANEASFVAQAADLAALLSSEA